MSALELLTLGMPAIIFLYLLIISIITSWIHCIIVNGNRRK